MNQPCDENDAVSGTGRRAWPFSARKKALTHISPLSFYQNVRDEFARSHIQDRWVIVSLSVTREIERDIVIEEPAQYDEEAGTYIALPFQYLYLSGDSVYSIAACSTPSDRRQTEIWGPISLDEASDGGQ